MSIHYYRLHDIEPNGMIEVAENNLDYWNDQGFGIFRSVQPFKGPRRKENLECVRAWAVDIDKGSKKIQQARIRQSPLAPSEIVETKNGYHVYFYAAPGSDPDHYRVLVTRICEFFGGDTNARDLSRVLRVPGYRHLKDPANPFMVKQIFYQPGNVYTEAQILGSFPPSSEERKASRSRGDNRRLAARTRGVSVGTDSFWLRVYDLDAREALERLSGHDVVNGEHFTFMETYGGKSNILVDGRKTSCWVDDEGHIGSHSGGGPTIYNWIVWYGVPGREACQTIREVFPEVADVE